ncbi:leucine-rich repeat-containing protein 74A-like [Helicoverpa zea]|uniref:leucine-rich repeat-containing protein 74A-like n=1 Tax=Helicoverpa zea TaxID=7113 RepID=UPI001F58FFA0|nr:leucine-rich repeat-containing protein 74A-like [Helicoverpa zea]
MESTSDSGHSDKTIDFLFVAQEEQSSVGEAPLHEWASYIAPVVKENKKRQLNAEGLYDPGSGLLCNKYLAVSDSSIFRHLYYNYPGVSDPGIKEALLLSEKPVVYPDDGQDLYLDLCKEMNSCPVRMFHRNLMNSEINISYYGVNPQGVRAMAKALQYNKNVCTLNLTGNFLNDDACYHLGRMLATNNTLTELILDGCRIGASGILRLGDNFRLNRTLEHLSLANNELGEAGGLHFAQQVFEGATVKRVNLKKNQLGRQTALALAEVWEWKNRFTCLDLSWNNFFHVPSMVKMLDQLALSEWLVELNLSFNSLEGERVANAIKNILLIPTLVVLNLSHNKLQKEAIEIIISNLISAKKLTTFDLSYNPLTPQDAQSVLQKMLRPRIKITSLVMKGVCVQKPFLALLARVKRMKSRKNFECYFDTVLQNWTIVEPDARELILQRAQYLGKSGRKNKVDTALYFLKLAKEYDRSVTPKDFIERIAEDRVAIDDDLIEELSWVFPGPKTPKSRTINLNLVCEFIQRLWPDKQLPPTPPPEPEPEPEPEPPPPPPKGKGKKKGK